MSSDKNLTDNSDRNVDTSSKVVPKKKKSFLKWLFKVDTAGDDNFNQKLKRILIIYGSLCLLLLGGSYIRDITTVSKVKDNAEYQDFNTFLSAVENDEIYSAYTSSDSTRLYYQYIDDVDMNLRDKDPSNVSIMKLDITTWHYTNYIRYDDFDKIRAQHTVPIISGRFSSMFSTSLTFIISISSSVFMIYIMVFMLTMIAKNMNVNANKYEVSTSSDYSFSDVIGHDEVINDIKQYVSLLQKDKKKLKDIHVKPPKGILFTGRPGTGKTLLAKAMAGEAGVPFIYMNTSNVIEMYVGVGAKTIRACFRKARELAPCVVFLDEIDAIGGGRGSNKIGSSEDTQTLLALLQEMDGFSGADGILIIAATNCPESLDAALKRSGRFDREIMISPPRNASVRKKMLEHYTQYYRLDSDVNLDIFSKQLVNMTGADIANICNEAAVINIMENGGELRAVTMQNLMDAMDKLLLKGNKVDNKNRVNQKDRQIVAYHEAGHAIMNYILNEPISRISIQGTTSGVGGFVMSADNDSQFKSYRDLYNNILVAYGGRASEIIKFGKDNMTTGAVNDIEQGTNMLKLMCLKYGFDDNLGMIDYESLLRDSIADKTVIQEILSERSACLMKETTKMLTDNYNLVEALALKLLDREVMDGNEVMDFLASEKTKKEFCGSAV